MTAARQGWHRLQRAGLAAALASLLAQGACREAVPTPVPRATTTTATAPAPAPSTTAPSASASAVPVARIAPSRPGGGLLLNRKSPYNHILVKDLGRQRTLLFVRDNGEEVVESMIDLDDPDHLAIAYTQAMFVSMLLRPVQQRVLIVGLGGGSMVRFLSRFFPDIEVDAVEIDQAIVETARDYFGVGPGPKVHIHTEDGFDFLRRSGPSYDVIYMDAFLKPGSETDLEGTPKRLKTVQFLKSLQTRMLPGGLFVVNLNEQPDTPSDITAIGQAFPTSYVFPVTDTGNIIAVGSLEAQKIPGKTLRDRGAELDRRDRYGFSFERLARMQKQ